MSEDYTSRTFAIIKPDGVKKKIIGRIIALAEENGLHVINMKFVTLTEAGVDALYSEHVGKDFYAAHQKFMMSGPCVLILFQMDGNPTACSTWRNICGLTDPEEARRTLTSSIRARWGIELPFNVVHGAEDDVSAQREWLIFSMEEHFRA